MSTVTTNGWDLVYAVRLPQVNARIAECYSGPKDFSAPSGNATVGGSFGSWQIVRGGAGYLVFLSVPVDGTVRQPGLSTLSFSGTLTLEVELNYLPAGSDPAQQSLRIRQPADGGDGGDGGGSTSLFRITGLDLGTGFNPVAHAFIQAALQTWLTANPDAIDHVFAVVDLTAVAAEAPYAWLRPTSLSYAYVDATGDDADGDGDGLLAILAMTQGRSAANLAQEVDAGAIPAGADAALLISPHLLLNDIILNALPITFPGTATGDFTPSPDGQSLTLANPVQLATIQCQGNSYQPQLRSFSIEFQGTQLLCQSQTSIPVYDGVTAYSSVKSIQGISIVPNGQGQPTLTFTEIGPPQIQHWDTTDVTIDDVEEACGVALILAGTAASIVTGGLAGVATALACTLIGGVIENLPVLIAAWAPDTAPGLDLMAANVTDPFAWTGGNAFTVATATLDNAVVLSGSPWTPRETAP